MYFMHQQPDNCFSEIFSTWPTGWLPPVSANCFIFSRLLDQWFFGVFFYPHFPYLICGIIRHSHQRHSSSIHCITKGLFCLYVQNSISLQMWSLWHILEELQRLVGKNILFFFICLPLHRNMAVILPSPTCLHWIAIETFAQAMCWSC